MRQWIVGAVLAVLVVGGLVAYEVLPAAIDRAHTAAAAHRAGRALAQVRFPAELMPCLESIEADVARESAVGVVCRQSSTPSVQTAGELRDALRRAGATAVEARCLQVPRLGTWCTVTGDVSGVHLDLSVETRVDNSTTPATVYGSFVTGGAGPFDVLTRPEAPSRATPIRVP